MSIVVKKEIVDVLYLIISLGIDIIENMKV